MAKLTVRARGDSPAIDTYQAPRSATGVVSSVAMAPPGFSLWVCDSELADGAAITWEGVHGDDGLYVSSGSLELDGKICPAGGALIVESNVETIARAVGPTRVVHFGSADPAPPSNGISGTPCPDGHGAHVIGPQGMFQSGRLEGVHAVWFADGTCATCRVQLFTVTGPPNTSKRGKGHTHSEDEIIYVIDGLVSMGAHTYGRDTALCIPGNVRYALVGGPDGHTFLNFRRDVSEQVYVRGSAPILETALARGGVATNDIR